MGEFINNIYASEPVAIYSDGGGIVDDYMKAADLYNYRERKVKILGSCRSACILALSVNDVCVGPNAVVKAHHAYHHDTKELHPEITQMMLDRLPYRVRETLQGNITRSYNSKATLTASQLIRLGVKPCNTVYKSQD